MRLPQIPKKPKYRIDTPTQFMMYATAGFFDLIQLVPKVFILLGMAAEVIPFLGWIVGTAAIGVGTALDLVLGITVSLFGYLTLWLWFQFLGVHIFSGKYMGRKALALPATMLIEMVPVANAFFSITFWTWYTIRISQKEDKEAHATLVHKMQIQEKMLIRREHIRVAQLAEMQKQIAERQAWSAANADTPRRLEEGRVPA